MDNHNDGKRSRLVGPPAFPEQRWFSSMASRTIQHHATSRPMSGENKVNQLLSSGKPFASTVIPSPGRTG